MKDTTVAQVQYVEALLAKGLFNFLLRPEMSGTEHLHQLLALRQERPASTVIIANHINAYDPLYLSAAIAGTLGKKLYPIWLPAKKRFFSNPLKRMVMHWHGCLPIGIGKDEDSLRSLKAIIEKVRDGDTICVFPEGQVSHNGTLGNDMGFVTFLARRSDLILLPIVLAGIKSFKTEWWPLLSRRRQLRITVGKPLYIMRGNTVNCIELLAHTGHAPTLWTSDDLSEKLTPAVIPKEPRHD